MGSLQNVSGYHSVGSVTSHPVSDPLACLLHLFQLLQIDHGNHLAARFLDVLFHLVRQVPDPLQIIDVPLVVFLDQGFVERSAVGQPPFPLLFAATNQLRRYRLRGRERGGQTQQPEKPPPPAGIMTCNA